MFKPSACLWLALKLKDNFVILINEKEIKENFVVLFINPFLSCFVYFVFHSIVMMFVIV